MPKGQHPTWMKITIDLPTLKVITDPFWTTFIWFGQSHTIQTKQAIELMERVTDAKRTTPSS